MGGGVTGGGYCVAAGLGGGAEPVGGVLQGVVGREGSATGGQFPIDDAVGVVFGGLAGDVAGADVDQQGTHGFGAEVQAEGVLG
jgi:hypothetical protein